MIRVIRYGRKSPNGWSDEGNSESAQDAHTLAYCEREGLQPVGDMIFDLFAKSATLKRPGIQRALAMIDAGEADGLVVYRLDRLTRSLKDLLTLTDGPFAPGKAQLHSVHEKLDTASATGRMLVNILGTVNQWQREIIGENTRETLATLKAQGKSIGGVPPYGWRRVIDGEGKARLERVVKEQAVIQFVRWKVRQGMAQDDIARRLNDSLTPTRSGRPWSRRGVQCILSQPSTDGSMDEARAGKEA